MQALLAGSVLSRSSLLGVINSEYTEVVRTHRVRQTRRRQLLQVLHSTRALDTSLKEFTTLHGIPVPNPSLGGYLVALERNRPRSTLRLLPSVQRLHYQATIVRPRNRYMHDADAYPRDDREIQTLLAEMHNCLVAVLNL